MDQEKINKNFKKWVSTLEKNGVDPEGILNLMGKDLVGMKSELFQYEGGLIFESLTLTKYAVALNKLLPSDKAINLNSLLKVTLLSNIGVVGNSEAFKGLDIKTKSLAYLFECNVPLSVDEYAAFVNPKTNMSMLIESANNMVKLEIK